MQNKISLKTISALVKVIIGGGNGYSTPIGIYRTGREIVHFFMTCDVPMSIGHTQSRESATADTLKKLKEQEDANIVLTKIVEAAADPREYVGNPDKGKAVIDYLNSFLEEDGFVINVVNGRAKLTEKAAGSVVVSDMISKTVLLNFDTVQREVERAVQSIKEDPEDAVTAACSLIESVCRSILSELNLEYPAKKDIESLIKAVQEPLGLSPGRTDFPKEIEQDIRQILSGLVSVAKGIGSLRTHGGDAHGREKGFRRIDERMARFAVYSANSLALFLIETWEKKQKQKRVLISVG